MKRLAILLAAAFVGVAGIAGTAYAYVNIEPPNSTNPYFGKVRVGQSVTKSVTLVNHSYPSETVTLKTTYCTDFNWPYGPSPAFDCDHELGSVVLAPGESTQVDVTFAPPSGGFFQADLYVTGTDSSGREFDQGATSPYGKGCVKRHHHLRC